MSTFFLCPISTVFQYFTDAGIPLAGGKIYTYLAGSSTPTPTWTDSTGVTPNSNPIILNSAGRLNNVEIWQQSRVPIKVIVTTAAGVQIGPTFDNLAGIGDPGSLLTTFFGGTDSGSANAYSLSFSANFNSYIDGLVIYWVPSNANTGASTVNINGLGAVNMLYGNGQSLSAGAIQAGVMTAMISSGGNFLLLDPANSQGTFSSGSFTATINGCTTAPTLTVKYATAGSLVMLNVPATPGGLTSNSTSFSLSGLPTALQLAVGAPTAQVWGMLAIDNGVTTYGAGDAFISAASGNINYEYKGSSWTNSGNKFMGGFIFPYFKNTNFT